MRSHISGKSTWVRTENLQKSLIVRTFVVVLKEPHPSEIEAPIERESDHVTAATQLMVLLAKTGEYLFSLRSNTPKRFDQQFMRLLFL